MSSKTPDQPLGAEGQAPEEEEKWWEIGKEEKLKRLRPQGKEIVILNLSVRSSDAYYNYKSHVYAIYKQPLVKYEDPYVIDDIRVEEMCCGFYQEYNCYDIEDFLNKLESEGFTVVKVFEA